VVRQVVRRVMRQVMRQAMAHVVGQMMCDVTTLAMGDTARGMARKLTAVVARERPAARGACHLAIGGNRRTIGSGAGGIGTDDR